MKRSAFVHSYSHLPAYAQHMARIVRLAQRRKRRRRHKRAVLRRKRKGQV